MIMHYYTELIDICRLVNGLDYDVDVWVEAGEEREPRKRNISTGGGVAYEELLHAEYALIYNSQWKIMVDHVTSSWCWGGCC